MMDPVIRTVVSLVLWWVSSVHLDPGMMMRYRRDPPSVNGTGGPVVLLHDYMVFLYRSSSPLQQQQQRRELNDSVSMMGLAAANTVTSFVDQGTDQASWGRGGQRYVFDLSSLPEQRLVIGAELRILRKPPVPDLLPTPTTAGGNLYSILLYACSPEGGSGRRRRRRQLLASRTVEVLDSALPRWEVFDVWAGVKARRSHGGGPGSARVCFHLLAVSELTGEEVADPPPGSLGLARHGRPHHEKALLVAFSHADGNDNHLFTEIREKMKTTTAQSFGFPGLPLKRSRNAAVRQGKRRHRRRRQRRTALSSNRSFGAIGGGGGGAIGGGGGGGGVSGGGVSGGGKGGAAGRRSRTRCHRRALHVNFRDLGWDDWIIAPLDYEAHHCGGACDFPLRSHLEPTNHAIIQTLVSSMDPDAGVPPSCCVPAKLSPIGILYIDSGNNVVYKQYEDMVVESCGCR